MYNITLHCNALHYILWHYMTCVCTCVHTYMHTCVHTYIRSTYIQRTYIHTYIHKYTYILFDFEGAARVVKLSVATETDALHPAILDGMPLAFILRKRAVLWAAAPESNARDITEPKRPYHYQGHRKVDSYCVWIAEQSRHQKDRQQAYCHL